MPGVREPPARGDGPLPGLSAHTRAVTAAIAVAAALASMTVFAVWLGCRLYREAYGPPIALKHEGEETQ